MDNFLDLYFEKPEKLQILIIFISQERIACIRGTQILWEMDPKFLKLVEINGKVLLLHFADSKNVGQREINLNSEEGALEAYQKLNQIIQD